MNNWKLVLATVAVAGFAVGVPAGAEPLTIEKVVELNGLQIGDDAIIAKIQSDNTVFDLSTDQIIDLRKKGLSSAVVAAMLKTKGGPKLSLDSPDPMVPHAPGLYILEGSGSTAKMSKMNFTVSSQAKTGGILGYAFTGGLASMSVKVAIQNETAPVKTTTNPKFYFFFDGTSQEGASNTWASGANTYVNSPAEFTLVQLTKKSGRREARVGSMNIAGAKSGVMDKDRLAFRSNELRPGVYEVTPSATLQPGEYGFIFSLAGAGSGGAMTARIFDFSVN